MKRYKDTRIKKYLNKRSLSTTLYENVPKKDTDQYFIAQDGDRCDNLATKFYGDVSLWWFSWNISKDTNFNRKSKRVIKC